MHNVDNKFWWYCFNFINKNSWHFRACDSNSYDQLGIRNNTMSLIPIAITCPALSIAQEAMTNLLANYPNPATSVLNIFPNKNRI